MSAELCIIALSLVLKSIKDNYFKEPYGVPLIGADGPQETFLLNDYLTCGRCLMEFPLKRITTFIEHKKFDCETQNEEASSPGLQCSSCPQGFMTAVGLLKHAQFSHNLKLFLELGPYKGGVHSRSNYDTPAASATEDDAPTFTPFSILPGSYGELYTHTAQSRGAETFLTENVSREAVDMTIHSWLPRHNAEDLTNVSHSRMPLSFSYTPEGEVEGKEMVKSVQVSRVNDVKKRSEKQKHTNQSSGHLTQGDVQSRETQRSSTHSSEVESTIKESTVLSEKIEEVKMTGEDEIEDSENVDKPEVEGAEEENKGCCTNQKCGVTVIPGSHESLKKCCYAVAPKKRKRHMEIKHMPKYWSSRLSKRRSFSSSSSSSDNRPPRPSSRSTGTLYIDLEPETGLVKTSRKSEASDRTSTQMTSIGNSQNFDFQLSGMQRENLPVGVSMGKRLSHGSVIIAPGTSFSIPLPYTIPTQALEGGVLFKSQGETNQNPIDTEPPARPPDPKIAKTVSETIVKESSPIQQGSLSVFQSSTASSETSVQNSGDEFQADIDVNSLLSMALSQAGMTQSTEITSEGGALGVETGMLGDNDPPHNRKRRYPTSKPFKCDQCEHAFNQRIHLKKHMSKHTGIKPFKCQQCDYSTVERSHLKVHIRIHTGEKPFKCTYCEYATAQNSTLKIHLKRHHGRQASSRPMNSEECTCSVCGKRIPKEKLSSHISRHQGETSSNQGEEKEKKDQ